MFFLLDTTYTRKIMFSEKKYVQLNALIIRERYKSVQELDLLSKFKKA